jgi:hypothetical protein
MEFLTSNIRAMAKHQCAWPTDRGRPVCLPAYLTALPELRVPRSVASTREYRRRLHRYATPGTSGYISAKVFGDSLSRVVPGTPVSAWRRVPFQSGAMGGFAAAVRCLQGKDVLVIGGGDTGCDCIGASSHACALLQRSACCSAARDNTACLPVRRSSAQHGPCRKRLSLVHHCALACDRAPRRRHPIAVTQQHTPPHVAYATAARRWIWHTTGTCRAGWDRRSIQRPTTARRHRRAPWRQVRDELRAHAGAARGQGRRQPVAASEPPSPSLWPDPRVLASTLGSGWVLASTLGSGGVLASTLGSGWVPRGAAALPCATGRSAFRAGGAWLCSRPSPRRGSHGSPLPHLRMDSARRCHICAAAHTARRCHICAGTGLAAATSAPGLGSPLPHLRRDWARSARRCHICAGTGLAAATSAPGLGANDCCVVSSGRGSSASTTATRRRTPREPPSRDAIFSASRPAAPHPLRIAAAHLSHAPGARVCVRARACARVFARARTPPQGA